MRISEVRIFRYPLPVIGGYAMSTSSVSTPETTIIEIDTDTGLTGYGEVCMGTPNAQEANNDSIRTALRLLAPDLLGLDPTKIGLVAAVLAETIDGHNEAKSAIDIACWDLLGKSLGYRVCDLLGGARSNPVPTYHVVGIASPEVAAAQASELQDSGLRKFQLKSGGRNIAEDIESIRAVAAVLRQDTELAVDTNRGWTTMQAQMVSSACRDIQVSMEQPCKTYAENVQVRPLLHHPLILDESMADVATVVRAVGSGVVDGLGMKTSRVGGLSAMRAVRDVCHATSIPMSSDDAWGGDIIAAACVHMGSTIAPRLSRGSWIAQPYVGEHYDDVNGSRIVDGQIPIPDGGPGLGLVIEPSRFGQPESAFS